mgnify:FL=1
MLFRSKHLPTEAQWEYAARGQDGREYPWGNKKPKKSLANYRAKATGKLTECGDFPEGVSPFKCYDMAGNAWEWCYDWYNESYYSQSPQCNPAGAKKGREKVCRGGAWTYDIDSLKTFYRFYGEATLRDKGYGFRCALYL